jgi:uncharacterized repeat protein (TIGR03803 family)
MKTIVWISALGLSLLLAGLSSGQTVQEVFPYPSTMPANAGAVTLGQGRNAELFGTTSGYAQSGTQTDGSVFTVSIQKQPNILHEFDGADGQSPLNGVTLATDGNYYGTTSAGGTADAGVLFRISPGGVYTILYEFANGTDGEAPSAAPIQASDGNLYGITHQNDVTGGAIYKYSLSTNVFTTILSLPADGSQGTQNYSSFLQGSDGNLYGTTELGGSNGCGTLLKLSTSGALLRAYSFPCGTGGSVPIGPLVQASDGNIYGTTFMGGHLTSQGDCKSGCGTIFRLSNGIVSILYRFLGDPDGEYPIAGLIQGTDGNLYGTTERGGETESGTIFKITTAAQYQSLYSFSSSIGSEPTGALLQHSNGTFYGTTVLGGQNGDGAIYSLDMGLGSFIALVRYSGRIGQPVQILGQGLTGATGVTIGGVATTNFKVVYDTYMTAVIPAGATTGPVVVTTPTGTLTSNHNLRIVQ